MNEDSIINYPTPQFQRLGYLDKYRECNTNETDVTFKAGSPLRNYLIRYNKIDHRYSYKYKEVFKGLMAMVIGRKMFRPNGMIICDAELKEILKMRGLHIFQLPAVINAHVVDNEEAKRLANSCEGTITKQREMIEQTAEELKHKWFTEKPDSDISNLIPTPPELNILSGGEITAKIKSNILGIPGIFEPNNQNVCVLEGNNHPRAHHLKSALKVDAFHKAALWETVMKNFIRIERARGNATNKNAKKQFHPSTSIKAKVKQEITNEKAAKTTKKSKIYTLLCKLVITGFVIYLAVTKN